MLFWNGKHMQRRNFLRMAAAGSATSALMPAEGAQAATAASPAWNALRA